jgi:hypothetical protein
MATFFNWMRTFLQITCRSFLEWMPVEGPPTRTAAADKKTAEPGSQQVPKRNAEPGSQQRAAAELNWQPTKNTTAELDSRQKKSSHAGWCTSPLTTNRTVAERRQEVRDA